MERPLTCVSKTTIKGERFCVISCQHTSNQELCSSVSSLVTRMFTKTLFIALALFMVIGAVAATDDVRKVKRGTPCWCGKTKGVYWWLGNYKAKNCCYVPYGSCCH
ncbi:U-actitoxin-Bgr3b-like [Tubulanus polymorphus]|uniref:U-actitoxin-Bgr3b-like n=1 Tax=Tubulanus polymorphus TaxID=672921 RepID=UPI003DA2B247